MTQILFFILVVAIIFFATFLIGKYGLKNTSRLEKAWRIRKENKEKSKIKILELFEIQDKINNADIENLLSVSDATATNYLEELEKEGVIAQQGRTGKWVFYTKVNG